MELTESQYLNKLVRDLRKNGCVRSAAVSAAFAEVPRHVFLPDVALDDVYRAFESVATHYDSQGSPVSSSSAPAKMAIMLGQLDVRPGQRVLEIGAGTGYNAAVLAHLVGPEGHVTTVDVDPEITGPAREHLVTAGYGGVEVITGDGWLGAPEGMFDRIEAAVEVWDISPHWIGQLRDGGVLVVPLWVRPGLEVTVAFEKVGEELVSRSLDYGGFMALRGPHAGPERFAVVPGWAGRFDGATDEQEWMASLDDANEERVAVLRDLLRGEVRTQEAPRVPAGWNMCLAMEASDPVSFLGRTALWHMTAGLFDMNRPGLAVVDGARLVGFGKSAPLERLASFLAGAEPFDFDALAITAVPHGTRELVPSQLARPSYDLIVTYRGEAIPR